MAFGNSPLDQRRAIHRQRREAAQQDRFLQVLGQPTAQIPRQWVKQASHVAFWPMTTAIPQNYPIGFTVRMDDRVGELVGTYSDYVERWYWFRFTGERGLRVISQTRLAELVNLLSQPRVFLTAGRIRGNANTVMTPDVIYLPAHMEKAAG